MGEEGDLVATRLARGCRCFAVWLGEEVAAYGWLSTRAEWIGELGLEIRPATDEAYVWNCLTLPPHRQKGMFRALLSFIAAKARSEGLVRLWIGSVEEVGVRALADAGFVPLLRFDVVSLLWLGRLTVRAGHGADPGAVAAARQLLAVSGRPLRSGSSLRRIRSRRH